MEPRGAVEGEARAGPRVVAEEPPGAAEVVVEPPGAVEGEARAGPPTVVEEPPGAAEEVAVEPLGAVEGEARAGPPTEAEAAVVAQRALGAPQAPARGAEPSAVQLSVEGCHSIHRICFREERTCGTSGTLPGGRALRPGRVRQARAAARAPVASPPRVAARHSARRWARTPGSCLRRMRSACNVRFLVHLRQRSYFLLISIFVGFTRRWL